MTTTSRGLATPAEADLGDYDGFVHTDALCRLQQADYNTVTAIVGHTASETMKDGSEISEDSIVAVARDYCDSFEIEAKLDSLDD